MIEVDNEYREFKGNKTWWKEKHCNGIPAQNKISFKQEWQRFTNNKVVYPKKYPYSILEAPTDILNATRRFWVVKEKIQFNTFFPFHIFSHHSDHIRHITRLLSSVTVKTILTPFVFPDCLVPSRIQNITSFALGQMSQVWKTYKIDKSISQFWRNNKINSTNKNFQVMQMSILFKKYIFSTNY